MHKLKIGDHWIDVDENYLAFEMEYCKELLEEYYLAATDDNVSEEEYEELRKRTLEKRVEAWQRYNDTIPDNKNEL